MTELESTPLEETPARVTAIDLTRAVTMVLMIFVNDLWTVKGAPEWLEHVKAGVDGMGLADTVFPAFLFIVGLSLPFAIDARRKKGDNDLNLLWHVILRAFALVVMGVWMVNGESLDARATGISHGLWSVLMCASFILIWNQWPRAWPSWIAWTARAVGAAMLIWLAVIYRGEEGRFAPQWWGILGIIGWAYLLTGIVTVLAHGRLWALAVAWLLLAGLSMANAAHMVPYTFDILPSPLRDGTHAGLIMGGVVTATLFAGFVRRHDNRTMTIVFVLLSAGLLLAAQFTRPLWGISKISATPAWLFICSAITLLVFLLLYWLGDVAKKARWFSAIKPAGSDTLLTYLTPYFVYAAIFAQPLRLPDALTIGAVGLLKTFVFALICVWIAGLLSRWIRLRI